VFVRTLLLTILDFSGSADEIVEAYLESVGGRDAVLANDTQMPEPKKSMKRGRPSAGTQDETPQKPNGKRARKNTTHPKDTTPPASLKDVAFKPPSTNWEEAVKKIEALEDENGVVWVFLTWDSGHRTRHELTQVYRRCPQKVGDPSELGSGYIANDNIDAEVLRIPFVVYPCS
jgi:chromobox protein 1